MALIDDVKAICDRLTPLGWRDLLVKVTNSQLDISQNTPAQLRAALTKNLSAIDRTVPGFEDFDPIGTAGITLGRPSASLLYHALASPRVLRGSTGAVLGGFPNPQEIESVEHLVFGVQPPTVAALLASTGAKQLTVVVFASEYRPAPDTIDGAHADLVFSRTGIARIGTARSKYIPEVRGFWPEDENDPHGFRVIPVRFGAWLAVRSKGNSARVMRLAEPDSDENNRSFWVPVHKLFDGDECLAGLQLKLQAEAQFFNLKLQRVMASLGKTKTGFPFVITDGLADLQEKGEFGRLAVVPVVQVRLVAPAIVAGKPLTYKVPKNPNNRFAAYETKSGSRDHLGRSVEVHAFPAYVHARKKLVAGSIIDLNDEANVNGVVSAGGYEAVLHIDFTGEGWLDVKVSALGGVKGVSKDSQPAYILLGAPDFFPSVGQRELSEWSASPAIPGSFRGDQIWGVDPFPLSEIRLPANLQLPDSPFDPDEKTVTAVLGMAGPTSSPLAARVFDTLRSSTLPDDGAGVFAPGWDVSTDVKGPVTTGVLHLAAYGLGSPFPEDAKLCAALSTFWPTVAPDVYRTMSVHTGNAKLRGTVAPLTDEEIGQVGNLPWDGVPGPQIVTDGADQFVEMASFLNVDYVVIAIENRFSIRKLARITTEEYERRILAAARVHWVLSGGVSVWPARTQWLLVSFQDVSSGDPELASAQQQAGHILQGQVYRVQACFIGPDDPTVASPKGPRFRRLPLTQRNLFFISAEDPVALRRRGTDPKFGAVPAE